MAQVKQVINGEVLIRTTPGIQRVLDLFNRVRIHAGENPDLAASIRPQDVPQGWFQWAGFTTKTIKLQGLNTTSLQNIDKAIDNEITNNPENKAELLKLREIILRGMEYIADNQKRLLGAADLTDLSHAKVLAMELVIHTAKQAVMQAGNRAKYSIKVRELAGEYLQEPDIRATSSSDAQYMSCQTVLTNIIHIYDNNDKEVASRFDAFKKQVKGTDNQIDGGLKNIRHGLTLLCKTDRKLTELDLAKLDIMSQPDKLHHDYFIRTFFVQANEILETDDFEQIKTYLINTSFTVKDIDAFQQTYKSQFIKNLNPAQKQDLVDLLVAYKKMLGYQWLFNKISPLIDACGLGYYTSYAFYIERMTEDLVKTQRDLQIKLHRLCQVSEAMMLNKEKLGIGPKSPFAANLAYLIAKDPNADNGRYVGIKRLGHHASTLETLLPGSYFGEPIKVKEEFLTFHTAFTGLYSENPQTLFRDEVTEQLDKANEYELLAFTDHILEANKKLLAEYGEVLQKAKADKVKPEILNHLQAKHDELANFVENYHAPEKTNHGEETQLDDSLMASFVMVDEEELKRLEEQTKSAESYLTQFKEMIWPKKAPQPTAVEKKQTQEAAETQRKAEEELAAKHERIQAVKTQLISTIKNNQELGTQLNKTTAILQGKENEESQQRGKISFSNSNASGMNSEISSYKETFWFKFCNLFNIKPSKLEKLESILAETETSLESEQANLTTLNEQINTLKQKITNLTHKITEDKGLISNLVKELSQLEGEITSPRKSAGNQPTFHQALPPKTCAQESAEKQSLVINMPLPSISIFS